MDSPGCKVVKLASTKATLFSFSKLAFLSPIYSELTPLLNAQAAKNTVAALANKTIFFFIIFSLNQVY